MDGDFPSLLLMLADFMFASHLKSLIWLRGVRMWRHRCCCFVLCVCFLTLFLTRELRKHLLIPHRDSAVAQALISFDISRTTFIPVAAVR